MKSKIRSPKFKIFFSFLFLSIFVLATNVDAVEIQAASCQQADVQAAVDAALSGDLVAIPAGSCTWATAVKIPTTKKITITGAGKENTVITSSAETFYINQSGSRITEIGFFRPVTSPETFTIHATGKGWRIDHCKFINDNPISRRAIHVTAANATENPAGLIDHNDFDRCRIYVEGFSSAVYNNAEWYAKPRLGIGESVYIEDNTFYKLGGNCVDNMYSASYVARYNTVTGSSQFQVHPFVDATKRGPRNWEMYRNTFLVDDPNYTSNAWTMAFIRGGTGFVFENTVDSKYQAAIVLDNWRSFLSVAGTGPTGKCDGSSLWDGNEASNGWPCRDQIGRGQDSWLWTEPNPYPKQKSMPAYFWRNFKGSNLGAIIINNDCSPWILENRDYYNEVSSFDGTTGIGYGMLVNRPNTCTAGVGYWATDKGNWNKILGEEQGVLYKCVSENTWEAYYTPYTYPHPLRNEGPGGGILPAAPSGLTVR